MDPRRKVLTLMIELPGVDEIRYKMDYITDPHQEQPNKYTTVIGHYGPFLERFNFSLQAPKEWPNSKPYLTRPLDGIITPMWLGTWSKPQNTPSYQDLIQGKPPLQWVLIEYKTTHLRGNIWHSYIRSDVLQELLTKFNLAWKIVPASHPWGEPKLEPCVKKPYKIRQHIYVSAHEAKYFGATITWSDDDWSREEETFLGCRFLSEEEAKKAIRDFEISKGI